MNNDEIIALIKEALAEVAPTRTSDFAAIQMDTKIEDLGLDSIATMEMVNAIEERVDSTFPDEELAKVQRIGDLAGLIRGAASAPDPVTPADVSASAAGVAGLGFRTPCAAETPDRSEAPATQGTPG